MKKMTLLVGLIALSPLLTRGQESKGGQTLVDAQAVATKPKEEKKAAVNVPKPSSEVLGKKVVYGGFLADFARAEKKRPLLSLRTPIDPQKDLENVSFYPGTDKVQGVILFSIKF